MFFVVSGNIRKMRLKAKDLPEETIITNTISRFATGLIFYVIGHLVGLKIIFDHAFYVRLRLGHESRSKYNRNDVKELLNDYPFMHKEENLYSDVEVRNKLTHFDKKKIITTNNDINEKELKKKKNKLFVRDRNDE